jgi:hypothetical protein
MSDVFARSHAAARAKSEREARDAATAIASRQAQGRVAEAKKRADALAKPDPAYRPNLPMRGLG